MTLIEVIEWLQAVAATGDTGAQQVANIELNYPEPGAERLRVERDHHDMLVIFNR